MSIIPGLGQLPKPTTSTTRRVVLQPLWEWRFEVAHGSSVDVRLISGTAERDGTELALGVSYRFSGTKSKLLTWIGCELEFEATGATALADGSSGVDEYVAEHAGPDETPMVSYVNLHFLLDGQRRAAAGTQRQGPRILIAGPPNAGKTSLARTLAALGARSGAQPCVANTDPREGMLSLPGTLTAAVFATVMDVESEGGWGGTPSSGPSPVPVKLPLAYYYGRERAEDDVRLYRTLVSRLAGAATARMAADSEVRRSGLVVDTPGVNMSAKQGLEILAHIVEEFSVNIVVVLGSARMSSELTKRFASERTSVGEPINVVLLDKSEGVVERDEGFMQMAQEAAIKEYFFGDSKRTLSPFTQQVDFDAVTIYRTPDASEYMTDDAPLEKVEPTAALSHWTMAVMNASVSDSLETIQTATIMGFVYVADVDKDRRRLKVLAPVSGRLGDRPLILGRWPEQYINLLG